ncbi:hypothetical protein K470DRAFT_259780 [Piedraia hortae CBS 480.64]|uniref:Uncharacterized protein n=1 Tax=Piedraia hortae CBS 480.64 TaxID=1314780 RepID=A0A6A7BTE5_9PEZI|nr:hypothetical protein K470DRAFT_259780 [Piedraia hortae CBS 480.64]
MTLNKKASALAVPVPMISRMSNAASLLVVQIPRQVPWETASTHRLATMRVTLSLAAVQGRVMFNAVFTVKMYTGCYRMYLIVVD